MEPDYLQITKTEFMNRPWTYVKARERLVISVGYTELSERLVCIAQRRPTFEKLVLSAPMGTFHGDKPISSYIAAEEFQSETGHYALSADYIMTIARSSGLTDELADVYRCTASEEAGAQSLHPDEDISVVYFDSRDSLRQLLMSGDSPYIHDASLAIYLHH